MARNVDASAAPALRQFSFFISSQLPACDSLSNTQNISVISAGQGLLLVGDVNGQIELLARDMSVQRSWIAYAGGRCTLAEWSSVKGVLATVGDELGNSSSVLKIWNLRHRPTPTSTPQLLGTSVLPTVQPVSVLALTTSLSYLAIGRADGSILLYRHLDQALANAAAAGFKGSPPPLPKPKVIFSSQEAITGLAFRLPDLSTSSFDPSLQATTSSKSQSVLLWAVTISSTYLIPVGSSRSTTAPAPLDVIGAALHCTSLTGGNKGDLLLARPEALYIYTPEGRGPCLAYESTKALVKSAWSRYVAVVSPPQEASAASGSRTVRAWVRGGGEGWLGRVIVFDPDNKLVVWSGGFEGGVKDIWCEWDAIYILSDTGTITKLDEISITSKLEMLYEKHLYQLAATVANADDSAGIAVAEVYQKWGDNLYSKGEYESAMEQYVKTVGHVRPSTIIRKYIDAQRIASLAQYLQHLHEKGFANADHTTLLLNCYTKLKDPAKLSAFLRSSMTHVSKSSDETNEGKASNNEPPFDLTTAIRVCRQAGYHDHALYLAERYGDDEERLRVLIEDLEQWDKAVTFIRSLGPVKAQNHLLRYGKSLLANAPQLTTDALIDLCCGSLTQISSTTSTTQQESTPEATVKEAGGSYLSLLSRGTITTTTPSTPSTVMNLEDRFGPTEAAKLAAANANANRKSGIYNPNLVFTLGANANGDSSNNAASTGTATGLSDFDQVPKINLPPLRPFFAFFIDRPIEFLRFLETVAERRWGQNISVDGLKQRRVVDEKGRRVTYDDEDDREAVWGTLLELCLQLNDSPAPIAPPSMTKQVTGSFQYDPTVLKDKAFSLLSACDQLNIDSSQALLVCTTYSFIPGIILLYERLGMEDDIIRFWISRAQDPTVSEVEQCQASKNVVEALKKYTEENYISHHVDDNDDNNDQKHLYPLVLKFLTSTGSMLSRHQDDLVDILKRVEEEHLMSPISVVQTLSKSGVASIGTIKSFLLNHIQHEKLELDADLKLMESYRESITKKRQHIQTLSNPKQPIIIQASNCFTCEGRLDLPAIHFMCQHSFHQRCLLRDESECPICAQAHGLVREIRHNHDRLAHRHDLFLEEVSESEHPFDHISSAFSKGLLDFTRIPTQV